MIENSSRLFIEPTEKDPLTAQTLHQVAHDIHEFGILKERLNWFLLYIMTILLYVGLNATLLVANSYPQTYIESHYELPMNYISFWGVFLFTVVEAILLISTGVVSWNNRYQSSVVLFDVGLSFFSATLYSLDPETFEIPAHYVEYLVQIPITCVNLIFVNRTYTRTRTTTTTNPSSTGMADDEDTVKLSSLSIRIYRYIEIGSSYGVLLLSVLQLILYSGLLQVTMGNERSAHFCEFTNEMINGFFAFEYAVRCYNEWKQQLDQHSI